MGKIDLDNVFGNPKFVNTTPIYPVKLMDMPDLYECSTCLLLPKNTMTDIKIIKMSYLAFLIEVSFTDGNAHLFDKLKRLMQITTRCEDIQFARDDKNKYSILVGESHEIYESEFEKFRDIIATQNIIDVRDNSTGSDFDKAKMSAKEHLTKMNSKMADLEQQIIAYRCVQQESYDNIKNLTIYQFRKEMERIDLIKSSDVLQMVQYNGMVKFKDGKPAPHWLDYIANKNIDDELVLNKKQLDKIAKDAGLATK